MGETAGWCLSLIGNRDRAGSLSTDLSLFLLFEKLIIWLGQVFVAADGIFTESCGIFHYGTRTL